MNGECQTDTRLDPATVLADVQRLLAQLVGPRAPAPSAHLSVVADNEAADERARATASPAPATAARRLELPTASQVRYRIRQRELRENAFESGLVSDPIWGMLLALLLAHLECRHICVKEVSIASGVPAATALRHIERLGQRGLIRRYPDPFDGRRIYLDLTEDALARLATLFSEMRGGAMSAVD